MALQQTEVYGEFAGVGGDPLEGVVVTLWLERPIRDGDSGQTYLPERVTATSDAAGEVSLTVVSNEDAAAQPENVYYRLTVEYPWGDRVAKRVSVPASELVSVFDLLEIEPGEPGDGDVGPAGPQGPRGTPGLVYAGGWDVATAYDADEIVEHEGSAYLAEVAIAAGVEPPAGDWALLVSKGDQGVKGDTGDTGDTGAKGDTGDFVNRWQGEWSAEGTYADGDLVRHDGSVYLADGAPGAAEPPDAPWTLAVRRGTDGEGSPATGLSGSVTSATQAGAVGTSTEYAREDHTHPSGSFEAGGAVAAHEGAADPHPQYSEEGHTHDDRYYTESETDGLLDGKQGVGDYVESADYTTITEVTQAEYDGLTPDANTLYIVVG